MIYTTTRYYSGLYQDTLGGYKKTKNIFVNGALLATFEKTGTASATPYYVLTDPLNSASILMSASGMATQTLDYLPYGDVRVNAKQTSYDSDRKFLGKINDVTTNLDYLEARYYQSPLGRFISQDPMQWGVPSAIGDPQSLNYYSYANGNPITGSDPLGLYNVQSGLVDSTTDTYVSVANDLNAAYGQQYGVWFQADALLAFNGGKKPVYGQYYGYSIDLANKYNVGGGYYAGGETNVPSGGGSTPGYYGNDTNGYGFTSQSTSAYSRSSGSTIAGHELRPVTTEDVGNMLWIAMMYGTPEGAELKLLEDGSFMIRSWKGYPAGVPKPSGPFKIINGEDYNAARSAANSANKSMHKADPGLSGLHIHEIQPVKFGGSPTDVANKIAIPPDLHYELNAWWSKIQNTFGY